MPLVIAVLIIVFIFTRFGETQKKNAKIEAIRAKDMRKTHAVLERRLVDKYMKYGYSFDDAYRKSRKDIVAAGYEPCIPRRAYTDNRQGIQSSYCPDVQNYDSFWVRERRYTIESEWCRAHPGELKIPHDELDPQVYANFPKTEEQYLRDLKAFSIRAKAVPVGDYLIYPGLGTCEVLKHNYIGDGYRGGFYTLKVLSSGKIVRYVKIGDQKISLPKG